MRKQKQKFDLVEQIKDEMGFPTKVELTSYKQDIINQMQNEFLLEIDKLGFKYYNPSDVENFIKTLLDNKSEEIESAIKLSIIKAQENERKRIFFGLKNSVEQIRNLFEDEEREEEIKTADKIEDELEEVNRLIKEADGTK